MTRGAAADSSGETAVQTLTLRSHVTRPATERARPELSASEPAAWKLTRLHDVAGRVGVHLGREPDHLIGLRDEGRLVARWADQPSEIERAAVALAWAEHGGLAGSVVHVVAARRPGGGLW